MSTLATAHVVAPLVLLDSGAAARAFLGIGGHPQCVRDVGTSGTAAASSARELHLVLQFPLPSFPVTTKGG